MNLCNVIGHLKTYLYYQFVFGSIGMDSLIIRPLKLDNPKSIYIGQSTYVGHFAWLMGGKQKNAITLHIGNNVQIGHFVHIVAEEKVILEDEVLLADKVFISDCTHKYDNIEISVQKQGIQRLKSVTIGEGSWIGENVCICGASVGRHCVIGANSIVLNDISDYSVAVGNPAKVVKQYSFKEKLWKAL